VIACPGLIGIGDGVSALSLTRAKRDAKLLIGIAFEQGRVLRETIFALAQQPWPGRLQRPNACCNFRPSRSNRAFSAARRISKAGPRRRSPAPVGRRDDGPDFQRLGQPFAPIVEALRQLFEAAPGSASPRPNLRGGCGVRSAAFRAATRRLAFPLRSKSSLRTGTPSRRRRWGSAPANRPRSRSGWYRFHGRSPRSTDLRRRGGANDDFLIERP